MLESSYKKYDRNLLNTIVKGSEMCKSLAEGGLRCEAHLNEGIRNLKSKYNEGLKEEAEKAGVPLNEATVAKAKKAHQQEMDAARAKLLAAHDSALEAKNATSKFTPPPFSSISNDLSSIKSKVKARFDRLVEVAEGAPSNSDILNSPELASFPYKNEYIDAIHLMKKYDDKMDVVFTKIKTSPDFDSSKKMSDYPEYNAELESLREQKQAVQEYIQPLRSKYTQNKQYLQKTGALYGGKDVAVIEYQVSKTPPTGSFKKLDYQIKALNFKRLKTEYEEKAAKGFNAAADTKEYAQANKLPLYDVDALKTFKTDVYDKTEKVTDLQTKLAVKTNQIKLTPGHRNRLEQNAVACEERGEVRAAKELRAQKKYWDRQAEREMEKNREIARSRDLKPQYP